jgi:hypothetical protein
MVAEIDNEDDEIFDLIVDGEIVRSGTEADLINWANAEGIEGYEIAEHAGDSD